MIFVHDHVYSNNYSGNRLFRRLVDDYRTLFRSSAEAEDQEVVVSEVVRVWRSREPPGRFLESTHPAISHFPLHDIGDEDARRRTSKLLRRRSDANSKNLDDVTASTAESSTLPTGTARRQNTASGRAQGRADRGDCFGGSFRGLVMSLFAGHNKDSIINQYLP